LTTTHGSETIKELRKPGSPSQFIRQLKTSLSSGRVASPGITVVQKAE